MRADGDDSKPVLVYAGPDVFRPCGRQPDLFLPGRGRALLQLTNDDTHVGWLLREGQINEREARNHPRRKVLQKSLGGRNQFNTPQVGAVAYEAGDIFLLCTDGLFDGLFDSQLEELLRTPETGRGGRTVADYLVGESLSRSGRDNTTAMAVQVF